ncbi:unnamed protein product [Parnassius apollo]|uniref:(apollo) hypothetical protein n=1 Tax=Parnassius apollo TaxID=110799 RepID=A0A8S3WKW2_PARAO|nr:unnamed protein product [Parnassius apollo]
MQIRKHKMVSRLLTTAIVLKNVCSINSQSEGWNKISRNFGENSEKTKTTRHKSTKSYMSNPMLTTEITESVFPDVTYPTSILDAREPFYFRSSGYDNVLRPFSDDVKMSYNALKADKRKKSSLSDYHSSSKPVKDAHKINTKDLESIKINLNNTSLNNERAFNDGTLGIDREEKETKSNLITSDSEVRAHLNLTDACTDSKNNEITVMTLKNSTSNVNFELPSIGINLATKERNESNVLFDKKNIVRNWNERDINLKCVIPNESEYNCNIDKNQFVSKEVSNDSQSNTYKSFDDKKHQRELSHSSKFIETPVEFLSTLYDTKKSFDSMLNIIENMLEPVKTLSNIPNGINLIDENSTNELQIVKESDIVMDRELVNKINDIENKENHISNIDALPTFTKHMNDDCYEIMNNMNKSPTNSLVEIFDNQNDSDISYGLRLSLTLENDMKDEQNEDIIAGLFPNYYVRENLKFIRDDKLIEGNTPHEYIKDFPVSDASYYLTFELDNITADKSALTLETVSEEDNSIETNVKSAANSLSIFDSFETTNNPFNIIFHSQPDIKAKINEENITELFPNYYVRENLKLKQHDKLIENNTSHEYIKDSPVFDDSYDLSFELDNITADKSALTFETISEEDNSTETNVKSAANSISIFDSFKTANNPFNIFF